MGKIKVQNLKEFEVKFSDAWKDVSDSSPEEGHRVLLTKLPDWIRRWVMEEQDRISNQTPTVEFVAVPGMTPNQVSD